MTGSGPSPAGAQPGGPHGLTPAQVDEGLCLLVLRHLHDGDVIDYPVPDENPLRRIFDLLVRRGWVARWDRIWPLRDRYRLTEKGISQIEAHYQPRGAERVMEEMRTAQVPPGQRRRWLRDRGCDPDYWPMLHDPYSHWQTWRDEPGPWHSWVHAAPRRETRQRDEGATADTGPLAPHVDDLDRQAGLVSESGRGLGVPFTDVS